ncbi:AraC family transcriptional regulator [Rhizobium sp. LjRoot254]|uniref:AraC family transcriptional regulator n=1 Tax=Rhizobium sp. LjRoot254 TaxID=3342297 RepID=UPI003ED0AA16
MEKKSSFLESLHYVPDTMWTAAAYTIVRAGMVSAGPDYRVVRDRHVGQDILFCLSGAGTVETLGRRFEIGPGQLAWIANELPHAHYAHPENPWTLRWFRVDGPNTLALREKIFGDSEPIVSVAEPMVLQAWFDRLFLAMRGGGTGLDLRLNQFVGEFLSIVDTAVRGDGQGGSPEQLSAVLLAMRGDLGRSWSGKDLASLAGLSPSHIRRLFRKHLRTSPHQWLLRERLTHAQALISDSGMAMSEIAEVCGFCDVYHFSREFKRSIGIPPATWRKREHGKVSYVSGG